MTTTDEHGNQHQEIDGWRITVSWFDPAKPTVMLKEIASNDTAVAWTGEADVEFESEPAKVGEYAKFRIPFDVLRQFILTTVTVKQKVERHIAAEVYRIAHPPIPKPTLRVLVQQYESGEFDPTRWNLCIDYNAVDLGEKAEDGGVKFTECIGFYVMGEGCGQCEHSFYWAVDRMPIEQLEAWIKKTFNVDRVLHGVG